MVTYYGFQNLLFKMEAMFEQYNLLSVSESNVAYNTAFWWH